VARQRERVIGIVAMVNVRNLDIGFVDGLIAMTSLKQKSPTQNSSGACLNTGGGCEIRTHGGLTSPAVFKTAGLNRSPKPPAEQYFNLCQEESLQITQKI
jgi:hypothetical protein